MKKQNKSNVTKLHNGKNIFKFLESSYNEAVSLLVFSRDYFAINSAHDKAQLSADDRLAYTLAMSTVTTQLTSVTSWLLICRAVQEGEVDIETLKSAAFKMPDLDLQLDADSPCFENLGDMPRSLLSQSYNLYDRIKRMEGTVQGALE